MLFISISLVILAIYFVLIYFRSQWPRKFSNGVLVLILFSFIANISLGQNYTASLINKGEGIGISNKLAYLIITDSGWGKYWSQELFRKFYENSNFITIGLIVLYAVLVFFETERKKNYYVNLDRYLN